MLFMFERFGRYNTNNTSFQFWQQGNHPIELFGTKAMLNSTKVELYS